MLIHSHTCFFFFKLMHQLDLFFNFLCSDDWVYWVPHSLQTSWYYRHGIKSNVSKRFPRVISIILAKRYSLPFFKQWLSRLERYCAIVNGGYPCQLGFQLTQPESTCRNVWDNGNDLLQVDSLSIHFFTNTVWQFPFLQCNVIIAWSPE